MGVRCHHGRNLSAALVLIFFVTALGSALIGFSQEKEERNFITHKQLEDKKWEQTAAGRLLIGPGSSPPTCRSRCGQCFPCWPVHVAIQPGRSFPLEYYPEAWRCKCGNKLFMP
ncbi:EPIDERMAL PATTERNING FACTOR-like protein 5 [Phalaenopsis equestris]|uniref:EPIDERMAL PATTERNING FACTOR-like protein 5 n=1 Tax=Phalaenopsis equestris TaxID=78828 RepID=UPI0009E46C33|nr:EPIDERMAL PATTERNING FACTOR-like protein 5 [Phalaenopsis equestris]